MGGAVQTTTFGVAAQVVARTRLEAVDAPTTISVSAEDLARGYKDIGARYRVHTTRMTRYVLTFAPLLGLADSVGIAGLGAPVNMQQDEIALLRPALAGASDLNLRFRLVLRPGLEAGAYALPLRLSVSPL